MAYEMKPNSGSLFKNDRKTADNHPNATGSCLIGGVEYWVSAWTKDGSKGKWQSLSFKPKDNDDAKLAAQKKRNADDLDDGIPF